MTTRNRAAPKIGFLLMTRNRAMSDTAKRLYKKAQGCAGSGALPWGNTSVTNTLKGLSSALLGFHFHTFRVKVASPSPREHENWGGGGGDCGISVLTYATRSV